MFPDSRSYVGYMVYLIDDKYLFTGGIIWFGSDGGDSFISALAEDNRLAVQSLAAFEEKLRSRGLHPKFITGYTGCADNMDFAFAHKDKLCSPFKKRVPDPTAPYDAYDESDDTEENAKQGLLAGVGMISDSPRANCTDIDTIFSKDGDKKYAR